MHRKVNILKRTFHLWSFLVLVVIFCFCCQQGEEAQSSSLRITAATYKLYKNFPSNIIEARNVEVWLPPGYDTIESLGVLYMFDGQNIFHGIKGWSGEYNCGWQIDEVLDSLINAKIIPPIMVVGIFNNGRKRGAEYMPAKPKDLLRDKINEAEDSWLNSFKENPPKSDEQLRFLVEELKPFIDYSFKTKSQTEFTFVGGASMGGLISAYAICEYPDVFGAAICMSTHWPILDGVFLHYLKDHLPNPKSHKIYFDYGTETLDAEYEPFQKKADEMMIAANYQKSENWMTKKFVGAKHHDEDWGERFDIPLKFILTQKD